MHDHEIRDHDHNLERVDRRECPDLGGATVQYECRDCDYWRAEWVAQPVITDFGGGRRAE